MVGSGEKANKYIQMGGSQSVMQPRNMSRVLRGTEDQNPSENYQNLNFQTDTNKGDFSGRHMNSVGKYKNQGPASTKLPHLMDKSRKNKASSSLSGIKNSS